MLGPSSITAKNLLEERLTRQTVTYLEACTHCGLCSDACHFYLATRDPRMSPVYKADRLRKLYLRYHGWWGRILPKRAGAIDLNRKAWEELKEAFFGSCTLCRRCSLNCPFGVDTVLLARASRSMLNSLGLTPGGLKEAVEIHLQTGNNMAVSEEELVDTLQWLEEQLRAEVDDSRASIPLNRPGSRILYLLNPREVKFFPLTILAVAKIFYAAGEAWTISSSYWDVTNYAYFSGDDEAARAIVLRARDEALRLGVEEVVLSECGHGYAAFCWEGPNWLGEPYPFRVSSLVEVLARLLSTRRIRTRQGAIPGPCTYHDPCNLARNGGIVEEPRLILRYIVSDFREMIPWGKDGFCCGGGGGMMAMREYTERRLGAGKLKAQQIRATGAKLVITPCHNCLEQLREINRHYQLGVEVKGLSELVAEALIL